MTKKTMFLLLGLMVAAPALADGRAVAQKAPLQKVTAARVQGASSGSHSSGYVSGDYDPRQVLLRNTMQADYSSSNHIVIAPYGANDRTGQQHAPNLGGAPVAGDDWVSAFKAEHGGRGPIQN